MYYRKDWFEEAGIAGPPKNFAEMTDIAVKLTDPAKNRYGFCMRGAAGGQALFMDMLHGFGLEPVVDGKAGAGPGGADRGHGLVHRPLHQAEGLPAQRPERWLPADHGVASRPARPR